MRLPQMAIVTHKVTAVSLVVTAFVVCALLVMCTQTRFHIQSSRTTASQSVAAPVGRYPPPSWRDDQGCASSINAFLHNNTLSEGDRERLQAVVETKRAPERMIVVPKMQEDDISWLSVYLPQIRHTIYAVDNVNAPFHPPVNKGNEAMTYLSYIIDHYDLLPQKIAFIHPHASSWHTPDTVDVLTRLRWDELEYANLRCVHLQPSCIGAGMHPLGPEQNEVAKAYDDAWPIVFEQDLGPLPAFVATHCCAQFVVSREKILSHSKQFYESCRDWLITTHWPSFTSGRVFEYTWHIMFGKFCLQSLACLSFLP